MTFESALPYVSIGCAVGAGAAAAVGPSPGVQRTLKSIALLALAVFAFLRGMAPAALAMALVLAGLSAATAPRTRGPSVVSTGLAILAWLVLAWLCLRAGVGLAAAGEPLRLGLIVLAAVASGALGTWIWRGPAEARDRGLLAAETGALALLLLSALTLRDAQWPAMAGAGGLIAARSLAAGLARRSNAPRPLEILCWVLSYLGLAAMAYVFLR